MKFIILFSILVLLCLLRLCTSSLEYIPNAKKEGEFVYLDTAYGGWLVPVNERYWGQGNDLFLSGSPTLVNNEDHSIGISQYSGVVKFQVAGLYRIQRYGISALFNGHTELYLVRDVENIMDIGNKRLFFLASIVNNSCNNVVSANYRPCSQEGLAN